MYSYLWRASFQNFPIVVLIGILPNRNFSRPGPVPLGKIFNQICSNFVFDSLGIFPIEISIRTWRWGLVVRAQPYTVTSPFKTTERSSAIHINNIVMGTQITCDLSLPVALK